ncbi:complement C1q-like protein 2 [Sinocyclocheilus rhinocerous]|uniref:Complement C1q-like protein 2 n=1 Tax=Sinocyclocheilus rhinocerous TaxID=307959 RepID=A0A673MCY6_9TELE|nr:PREDICTED: complement C1q-like protein 2 [Sinocyclocheilus rhinocerous]
MRLTIAVLLLLYKCLIFDSAATGLTIATELVTSELSTKDENKQLTCPFKICTDILKDLGATEKQLKALEIRLANSEAQIEEIKKENQDRPKVAFSASLGSNGFIGPVQADSTLVYKNVFINVGDAYNQDTGIFTTPVRGVYYFSFFYHCGTAHGTSLDLYRNGKQEALAAHHKSNDSPENGGNGLTLLLEKGDQVYMVLQNNKWIWDSENVTVFTGFLIDAM